MARILASIAEPDEEEEPLVSWLSSYDMATIHELVGVSRPRGAKDLYNTYTWSKGAIRSLELEPKSIEQDTRHCIDSRTSIGRIVVSVGFWRIITA